MGYPPQGYPQQQGAAPGYPPQQQGGYGYPPQQQGGYGYPPQQQQQSAYPGAPQQSGYGEYNMGELFNRADHSRGVLLEQGWYGVTIESSEYGRSRDGTKGQWKIVGRTDNGNNKLSTDITISAESEKAMGKMFRHLAAFGIPTPPPYGQPGTQGWWELGWTPQQVAQVMTGKHLEWFVIQNEYPEGSGQFNNKIQDMRAAPAVAPQQAPPGAPPAPPGMAPGPAGPPGPAPYAQPPYGQYGAAPAPAPPQAPGQAQTGPPQPGPAMPPGYDPNVPPYAQPAQPGQPGTGQFTPDGQATQPGTIGQQAAQPPAPPGQQQFPYPGQPAPGAQPGDAPAPPGWAGGPPPQ